MSERATEPGASRPMSAGRLEAFSDGVMAIIITIMAFNIATPEGSDWAAFEAIIPSLAIYALSFVMVGIYWNNHHHLVRTADRIDGWVMWANLFLLFCLSLIPVATTWVGNEGMEPLPAAAYGVVALLAGFAYFLLVRAIIHANGKDSAAARAIGSDVKGFASMAGYAAAVVVALVFESPWIAYCLYIAVAVMWLVPDRRFTRETA